MPDPEGFKLGSAWMAVKPNIDQAEWDAKVSAALVEAGKAAGVGTAGSSPLGRSLVASIDDAKPQLVRDADEIGTQVGEKISTSTATGFSRRLRTSRSQLAQGLEDAKPDLVSDADEIGTEVGDALATSTTAGVEGRLRDSRGRFISAGRESGQQLGAGLGDGLSKGIDPGLDDADKKIKGKAKKTGQDAGKAAGDGMSPLIVGALAGAATIGGAALLAGLGTAMVGATALVLHGNKTIAADFQHVGQDAAAAIEAAAAPLAGQMHQSLLDVDQQVRQLRPDFKELFAAAEPDIAAVTSGVSGLAGSLLPGMTRALNSSQVIVSDFSRSLPVLGSDIGGFFSGLVQNADLQGRALQGTVNTLGNTIETVGALIGSAGAATAEPLIGLTHVINGLDDAVRGLANPATVGGLVGVFGAMKLDPALSSGLKGASEGLAKVAEKGATSSGLLGEVGSLASKASGSLGKMASVIGGPWGLAIGGGLGLLSGLTAALGQADDATKAITVSQGDLAAAVEADNAKAGQATSAYIAQQAQVSGLADEAKQAGVSLTLLTEAATGNQAATAQLTDITSQANDVQRQQQAAATASLDAQAQLAATQQQGVVAVNSLYSSTTQLATGQDRLNGVFTTGSTRLTQSLAASNSLTDANQQLLNSVKAQTQQVADAINKQTELNAATTALNNSANIFRATLDANRQKLVDHAQATATSSVASLNLSDSQTALGQQLAGIESQYQLATAGAQGYNSLLTAMNGTTTSLDDAQNSLDQSLLNAKTSFAQNSYSLAQNTQAGINNREALSAAAKQIVALGVANYQSSGSMTQANGVIQQQINKFVDATGATGKTRRSILDYITSLAQIPPSVATTVSANTAPAQAAVKHLINDINASYGTVQVYSTTVSSGGKVDLTGGGKALGAGGKAGGGPVTAGSMIPVGEHGQETAVFGQDAYILTHGQTVGMQSRPPAPGAGTTVNATFNYYGPGAPSGAARAQMMRDLAMAIA